MLPPHDAQPKEVKGLFHYLLTITLQCCDKTTGHMALIRY